MIRVGKWWRRKTGSICGSCGAPLNKHTSFKVEYTALDGKGVMHICPTCAKLMDAISEVYVDE